MHTALRGSKLLIQRGAWHHGTFATGNRCIDTAVLAYLRAASLPRAHATCAAAPTDARPKRCLRDDEEPTAQLATARRIWTCLQVLPCP